MFGWDGLLFSFDMLPFIWNVKKNGCNLQIIPPERAKKVDIFIDRKQILETILIKVDKNGKFIHTEQIKNYEFLDESKPDENDLYDSYALILHPDGTRHKNNIELNDTILSKDKMEIMEEYGSVAATDPNLMEQLILNKRAHRLEEEKKKQEEESKSSKSVLPSLEKLNVLVRPNDSGEYLLPLRLYNVGHTKRGSITQYNKIQSYLNRRRTRMFIQENRNVAWQGILLMVIGCVSFLASLLIGQFREPRPVRNMRSREKITNLSGSSNKKEYRQNSY